MDTNLQHQVSTLTAKLRTSALAHKATTLALLNAASTALANIHAGTHDEAAHISTALRHIEAAKKQLNHF